jgi:NADH:ubiquinone oxidoreductase subunit 6 (subunit J)
VAFSRVFIGAMGFLGPVIAGFVLHLYGNAQVTVGGKVLTRYYLAFATASIITLSCIIPLILMGKRKVQ